MKLRNLFYLLLALPLAFASCDKDPDVEVKDPVLTLTSQGELSFTAAGGEGEITYKLENPKSGVKVEAKSDADWVVIKGAEDKVSFTVEANEEETARETKVVVSYEKLSFEVKVKQAAAEPVAEDPVLTLTSAEEVEFDAEGGAGEITYTLENAVDGIEVTAKADVPWVANFAVEADKVTYNVAANEEEESREAVITVEYGVLSFNVAVKQAAAEPAPIEEMTIADAIAAEENATITLKGVTVAGVYARGVLVSDATGKLLVYAGSALDAAIGDVVTVEGTMATYAGLRQVASPTVTKTGTTTYEHPAVEVLDGAGMDAYLTAPAVKYVEYTGTLVISGSYYNVNVDGATTAVGSIAYPIAGSVKAEDGQKIKVRGYAIGVSSSKYVNTMLVECEAIGDTPMVEEVKATVDEFLKAEEGTTTIYELTGKIANVANTFYGNFDLVDETGSVYVYGLYNEAGEKVFESLGLKEGDTITLKGKRTSYKDTPQVGNAVYVSHVPGEGGETPEVFDLDVTYAERFFDVDGTELDDNQVLVALINDDESVMMSLFFEGTEKTLAAGKYSTEAGNIVLDGCELYVDYEEVYLESVAADVAVAGDVYTLTVVATDEAGNTYNVAYEGEIVNMVVEEAPEPVLYVTSSRSIEMRAAAGEGTITYEVINPVAGVSLTAEADKGWITIGAIDDTTVKFSVKENTASSSRQGMITLTYGEQTATVTVNQIAEVNYVITAIEAKSYDAAKAWAITLFETNPIEGTMYTRITFELPEANTLYITDGTYSVANGTIRTSGENKSEWRYNNGSYRSDITNCEMTISVDPEKKSAKLSGYFVGGGTIYNVSYEGDIPGFLYEDVSSEELTEWESFGYDGKTYSNAGGYWYPIGGKAKNGTEVYLLLAKPGTDATALPAGTYVVGPWQYPVESNYCKAGEDLGGRWGDSVINGVGVVTGKVVVEEDAAGYKVSFDVIDGNGTEWVGEYVGPIE